MLEELQISGLGVIDAAVLAFDPGFTVVTGETGAGKTMVVTGLSLLLGTRADAGAVRAGADRAQVEGRWRLADDSAALRRAEDAGGRIDDGELIAVRSVTAAGRSRAVVGGTSVPVSVLADLGSSLVELHVQADQIELLRPAHQLAALDSFAGPPIRDALVRYRGAYHELAAVAAEHRELAEAAAVRAAERDRLLAALTEIAGVDPQPAEDTQLADEAARLTHADDLQAAASTANAALAGVDDLAGGGSADRGDVLSLLGTARKAVQAMAGHDPRLAQLGERLDELAVLAGELAVDLSGYVFDTETDPVRLDHVGARRAALAALVRRYHPTSEGAPLEADTLDGVDAVLAWAAAAAGRVGDLDGRDERVEVLARRRTDLRATVAVAAAELHGHRVAAAAAFGDAVTHELAALAMPHARIVVELTTRADPDGLLLLTDGGRTTAADTVPGVRVAFGPDGVDTAELLLAAHPGAPARPLARSASGGELSRVMLACEVVLGARSDVPTYVFDEVDAGVGGAAAVEVGRRLAALSAHGQVVVVTHLAQVAAFADAHYVVHKDQAGIITSSGVRPVEGDERVSELARMLAGDEGSATSRAHARELLESASARQTPTGTRTKR